MIRLASFPSLCLRLAIVCLAAHATASLAARNPEGYINVASDQVQLREIARIVSVDDHATPRIRRTTIVAKVIDVVRSPKLQEGDVIAIDYTVNLTERDRAAAEFQKTNGTRPGPQFMYEPDPPKLDEHRQFWANLAVPATRLGNVQRHAGAVVEFRSEVFSGPVYVPVAGQYSFERPAQLDR